MPQAHQRRPQINPRSLFKYAVPTAAALFGAPTAALAQTTRIDRTGQGHHPRGTAVGPHAHASGMHLIRRKDLEPEAERKRLAARKGSKGGSSGGGGGGGDDKKDHNDIITLTVPAGCNEHDVVLKYERTAAAGGRKGDYSRRALVAAAAAAAGARYII